MPLQESVAILPCSSLEELPTWHRGEEAAELLTAWTLPWHPWFLAHTGHLPTWRPPHADPQELSERIVLVPEISHQQAPSGWLERLEADGIDFLLVQSLGDRDEATERIFAEWGRLPVDDLPNPQGRNPLVDELTPEFFALGFASLVVELLGHAMHYSSNVDRTALQSAACDAARAAVEGDRDLAEQKIQRSFDLLAEARDYYYPVDSYFLDVTLVAPSVWGTPLRDRLSRLQPPTSILLSAAQVEQMAVEAPESVASIQAALAEDRSTLLGGDRHGGRLTGLSLEALLEDFNAAQAVYLTHLGRRPPIFGRFGGGFSPMLPCLLDGLGFRAALLAAFDGTAVPSGDLCRFRWEGVDGTGIDTLALTPLDAGDAGSLLQLPERLSYSMQHDHVATVLFASWPGCRSPFYEDLVRASQRCATLGQFVTLEHYLETSYGGDVPMMFAADTFLATSGQADPDDHQGDAREKVTRRRRIVEQACLLRGLADVVATPSQVSPPPGTIGEASAAAAQATDEVESLRPALERLAQVTGGKLAPLEPVDAGAASHPPGVLAVNLASGPRTICFAASAVRAEVAADSATPDSFAADVPPWGYAWQALGRAAAPVPLAEKLALRNEHFEVQINPQTGGIGSVHDYRHRGNRVSQQLAYRLPPGSHGSASSAAEDEPRYTRMVAEDVKVTASTAACGAITSRGRLLGARDRVAASFRQTTRVLRGSPWIELELEILDWDEALVVDEGAYLAARWAWRDEPIEVRRSLHGAAFPTAKRRIHAAEFIEMEESNGTLAVMAAAPLAHVRPQGNRLDSLVPLDAASGSPLRLALGIDPAGGAGAWVDSWHTPPLVAAAAGVPDSQRAWWLRCGSGRVRWRALAPLGDGRSGFCARLQETTGHHVGTSIEAFRPIRSARRVDLLGAPQVELPTHDGRIELQMAGYQWIQIEAEWE